MADTNLTLVAHHSANLTEHATAAFWLEAAEAGPGFIEAKHDRMHAAMHKLADLLGYELTKKPEVSPSASDAEAPTREAAM